MGSVLYLDRGMRRRNGTTAAAKIQATHVAPSILRPGYNCWTVARAERVAFLVGIDLTVRRFDSPEHAPDDPRRVAYGKPYPPFHDLMVAVDGEAARSLAALSRERWLAATGQKLKPVAFKGVSDNDPWPADFAPDLQ